VCPPPCGYPHITALKGRSILVIKYQLLAINLLALGQSLVVAQNGHNIHKQLLPLASKGLMLLEWLKKILKKPRFYTKKLYWY
jgi:hypothetical protein